MSSTFCPRPFEKMKITAQGHVNMCCFQEGYLGNILHQSLEDMWKSRLSQDIREATLRGELHKVCRGWGACPFIESPKINCFTVRDNVRPVELELDLPNTHCNIGGVDPTPETACFMCTRASKNFTPDPDLTIKIAEKVRHLMPGLNKLMILGVSEPFWKDAVFHVMDMLDFRKYKKDILFHTFSNATVFDDDKQMKLLEYCDKSKLNFSIDAATPKTYKTIRKADFSRMVHNIVSWKDKISGLAGHDLYISNNINVVNLGEAADMVDLAHRLGADGVLFNPTHDCGGFVDLKDLIVNEDNASLFKDAEFKITRRAKELGVEVRFARPMDLNMTKKSNRRVSLL